MVNRKTTQPLKGSLDINFDVFLKNTDFAEIEESCDESLPLGALGNDIHVLFQEAQFRDLPNDNFQVLEPSAQLASKFLESGTLDKFFHIIFHGSTTSAGKIRKVNTRQYVTSDMDPDVEVAAPQIDDVKRSLNQLAKHCHYRIAKEVENQGTTAPLNQTHQIARYPSGCKSEMRISRIGFDKLVEVAGKSPIDVPYLLTLQFEMAVLLLHELVHACWHFVNGSEGQNPFFGDSIINELGFEMENVLFGGHLTRIYHDEAAVKRYKHNNKKSLLRGIVAVWDWPYQLQAQNYIKDKAVDLLYRKEPIEVRSLDRAWRVELQFLQQLFTDDFGEDISLEKSKVLTPQRTQGFCFRVTYNDKCIPVSGAKTKKDEKMYIPAGYRRLASGDIVRRSAVTKHNTSVKSKASQGASKAVSAKKIPAKKTATKKTATKKRSTKKR